MKSTPALDSCMKTLSQLTVFRLCATVGQSIASMIAPDKVLDLLMQALLQWGSAAWGVSSPREFYLKAKTLSYAELAECAPGAKSEWSVHLLPCLRTSRSLKCPAVEVAGYKFQQRFVYNDRNSGHSASYLFAVSRGALPEWWQCHLAVKMTLVVAAGIDQAKEKDEVVIKRLIKNDWFVDRNGWRRLKWKPHEGIFPGVMHENRELFLTTHVVQNSMLSLFNAHVFFHMDELAHRCVFMATAHVRDLLSLDSLPVSSEDLVLRGLVDMCSKCTIETAKATLDKMLKHVRPQFITPEVLLKACHGRAQKSSTFKDILLWLIGGTVTKVPKDRPRTCYADPSDCRPQIKVRIVEQLLKLASSRKRRREEGNTRCSTGSGSSSSRSSNSRSKIKES